MKKPAFMGALALALSSCLPGLQGPPPEAPAPAVTANAVEVSRVTSDPQVEFSPRPSPNGEWILYSAYDPSQRGVNAFSIYATSPRGGARRPIAGPGAIWGTWLPDSKNIVYVSLSSGRSVLVRTSGGGAGTTFITNNPLGGADEQPDVSPDGKTIAFHTYLQGRYVLATIGIDGTSPTIYVPGTSPRWHPSGKKLVFNRQVDGKWHIFTLELETGQVTQLTSGPHNNAYPSWSPDGKWITFHSDREGRYQIYFMKEDGTAVTQMTRGEGSAVEPNWGTDGYIYFSSTFGNINLDKREEWRAADIWRVKPRLPEQ